MKYPTFIGIGAAKCGTTSIYEYLKQHPNVYMTPKKETNYFSFGEQTLDFGGPRGNLFRDEVISTHEEYVEQFSAVLNESAVGEISPSYLEIAGTAQKIKTYVPDVKIWAILRNPVERAFSSYLSFVRDGFEPCKTVREAIADEPKRLREKWAYALHVERGYYCRQLREYYRVFDERQIRIFLYDDLVSNPVKLMQELYSYIGVEENIIPDVKKRHNVSGVIKNPIMRFIWTKTHPIRAMIRPRPPKRIREKITRFFRGREMMRLTLPKETRLELQAMYRDDIVQLQDLIKRDLSSWLRDSS